MNSPLKIAVVGDFKAGRPSHEATDEAVRQGAEALGLTVRADWIPTREPATRAGIAGLAEYDGIFCAPGGPYESTEGALEAIRFARERGLPFLGT